MIIAKRRKRGNALMEYAVPMAIILLAAGVLATVMDIQGILGEYFMAASGHTSSDLNGGTFEVDKLAANASGSLGNGAGGFSGGFGSVSDGGGGAVGGGGYAGQFYTGPVNRSGGRPQAAGSNGNDRLYPVTGQGAMYDLARQLEAEGAPREYVARVLQGAMTTEQLGRTKADPSSGSMDAYNAALRAQMASNLAYAGANWAEVNAHGGSAGVAQWSSFMNSSLQNTDQINQVLNNMDLGMNMMSLDYYDRLRQEGANFDQFISSPGQCAAVGSSCAAGMVDASNIDSQLLVANVQMAFDIFGRMDPNLIYTEAFFDAIGAENVLMNSDNTRSYMQRDWLENTQNPKEAEFAAAIAEREAAEQAAACAADPTGPGC